MYIIVLIILLINTVYGFSCQTDSDCNSEGTCEPDHTCYCRWFYQGESCSIRWEDANNGWIEYWIFYCVYTCILQVFMLVLIVREIKSYKGKIQLNTVTLQLGLISFGLLGIESSLDLADSNSAFG